MHTVSSSHLYSPILTVKDLTITFNPSTEPFTAVNHIEFELTPGKTLAIVGQSGSGKSATALALTRLNPSNCSISGSIAYKGKDILNLNSSELRKLRGRHIAYIFQEPSICLNPSLTIGYQIAETIKTHFPETRDIRSKVIEYLMNVGIHQPESRLNAYPHELSGGMQQRIMIALALACQPSILVADEPTTALDVTLQKNILDLLKKLQSSHKMAMLLITHNLCLVADVADNVAVMYKGKIVETGPTLNILNSPKHVYTQGLIQCIPRLGQHTKRLTAIDYTKIDSLTH